MQRPVTPSKVNEETQRRQSRRKVRGDEEWSSSIAIATKAQSERKGGNWNQWEKKFGEKWERIWGKLYGDEAPERGERALILEPWR